MFNIFKRSASSQPKPSAPPPQVQTKVQPPPPKQIEQPTPTKQSAPREGRSGQDSYYRQEMKLRPNFAEELLNLELEIESQNLTMETVSKLLELYREAVEYFEAIQSNKYLVFKNKIHTLLTKKNVVDVMKMKLPSQQAQKVEVEPEMQKQKELQIRLNFIRGQDQTPNVENFISEQNTNQQKLDSMINQEITEQSQAIQQRIQQRRNSSIKRDGGQVFVNKEKDTPTKESDPPTQPISTTHVPVIKLSGIKQYSHAQRGSRVQEPVSDRPMTSTFQGEK